MATLLLKLAGPLQSWDASSRFTERKTRHEPTKSGVVGLLSAALGRSREESVDDLSALPFAVRVDQPGHFERDFQTAHPRRFDKNKKRWDFYTVGKGQTASLPLSQRYYVADAIYVAGVEVPGELLPRLMHALEHPAYPLYLGRRACPPAEKVLLAGLEDMSLMEAMARWPWQATSVSLLREYASNAFVECDVLGDEDVMIGWDGLREDVQDVAIQFSREERRYGWRTVVHGRVGIPNPHVLELSSVEHDPMQLLERGRSHVSH